LADKGGTPRGQFSSVSTPPLELRFFFGGKGGRGTSRGQFFSIFPPLEVGENVFGGEGEIGTKMMIFSL